MAGKRKSRFQDPPLTLLRPLLGYDLELILQARIFRLDQSKSVCGIEHRLELVTVLRAIGKEAEGKKRLSSETSIRAQINIYM